MAEIFVKLRHFLRANKMGTHDLYHALVSSASRYNKGISAKDLHKLLCSFCETEIVSQSEVAKLFTIFDGNRDASLHAEELAGFVAALDDDDVGSLDKTQLNLGDVTKRLDNYGIQHRKSLPAPDPENLYKHYLRLRELMRSEHWGARDIYRRIDINGDGKMDSLELKRGLHKLVRMLVVLPLQPWACVRACWLWGCFLATGQWFNGR